MLPKPGLCRGCAGFNWSNGTGFTLNEGYGRSGLLACAEAPGGNEEEESRPLSPNGASGKIFRRALRELGEDARELGITNILRCRPPDNELRGMPWEKEAIDWCMRQHFPRTMAHYQPKAILALGDLPLRELEAERIGSVTVVRGFVLPSRYEGIPLVSTYHPSYIARGAWQLYGAFKHDVATALRIAREGVVQLETSYELAPSVSTVESFIRHLVANPEHPVSYDVETASILGEEEPADWRLKRIVQIQFSIAAGHALVLPLANADQWETWSPFARAILALPNPKWGWNSRLSDDLAIAGLGWEIGGERHDLMNAWGHYQPSYWGGKDDRDTDKGVPSRLMGLQSCTSFYAPEVGPWKHLGTPEAIKADPSLLPLYGAKDADHTMRCGIGIMADLERTGLMAGYRSHKLDLVPVLDHLGEVGLPVDRERQAALRTYVTGELQRIQTAIQRQVPTEVLGIHPKQGYKSLAGKVALADNPDEKVPLKAILANYNTNEPPLVIAAGHIGYLKQREFYIEGANEQRNTRTAGRNGEKGHDISHSVELSAQDIPTNGSMAGQGVHRQNAVGGSEAGSGRAFRWCVERLYNPHGSSPNTKSYIRAMGYPMPKRLDDPDKDTTGKSELKKLADSTGDPVLALTYEWRELAKTGLDYTGGAWVPGDDGRVHATFKFGTASAQLVAVSPAVMTYPEHAEIAKMAKEAIRAEPGHTLVKVDMRGFHSRMIGWLANDPDYYRLADYDVHSFITAHFLHLHDAPYLLEMSDDELRGALGAIKAEHGHTRNYKVKRTVHGRQFNMGVNKLYTMHSQNFDPPEAAVAEELADKWPTWTRERQMDEIARRGRREARTLFDLFDRLFPRTFVVYPEQVANQLRNVTPCELVSPFAHHRYFYDYDKEQSTAFGPSNCAHCHIQAALVRMFRQRLLQRFEFCNFTHDAGWFHPEDRLVEECITTVQHEFELPSTVLVNSPLGPFQCNSDAEVGADLAHMSAWKG